MGGDHKEAERKLKLKRKEEAHQQANDALVKHIQEQDMRLRNTRLQKQAAARKRMEDAFDPRPAQRKMHQDTMLAMAAQVPGPGTYTPRLRVKDSSGCTFGATPFVSIGGGSCSVVYDREAGSPAAWKVKTAAAQPGPASYSPSPSRRSMGSTFGLPPELRGGKDVPSAHDMSKMVAHLRDLPAPDAYSPRNPVETNKGFRMVPSKAKTMLEHVIEEGSKVPGPGKYDLSSGLSAGRSTILGGAGLVKSELDLLMDCAKEVPGPGAYQHASTMRSKGSPRFSNAGGLSLIEAIQVEARKTPGPAAYHPTPTFAEELQMQRSMRKMVKEFN